MPDRHKHTPIRFRPPEADRSWLLEFAAETGNAVNAVLAAALAEFRARHGGPTAETAPVESGRPAAPRRTSQRKAAPSAVFVAVGQEQPQPSGKNCAHRNMRLSKGSCPDCGEWVTRKGS
jgi:hypothetical protein